jgi:hypothetical protein
VVAPVVIEVSCGIAPPIGQTKPRRRRCLRDYNY